MAIKGAEMRSRNSVLHQLDRKNVGQVKMKSQWLAVNVDAELASAELDG